MRAAFVDALGPPESIRYGELPDPVPSAAEVLVDVLATAVNPVDTFVRDGRYRTETPFPFVVGRDLVGRVAATANGFAAGDLVWCNSLGHAGRQGAAAELAAVAADRLYRLPAGVDPVGAVAVLHPAATAHLALATHGRLRAGEIVLVGGAGGNVGGALVTFARHAGARVVATASAADAGHCAALGADVVLDYADPQVSQRIRHACPDGVDVHVDTSGTNDLTAAVELLAPRGRIVLIAGRTTHPVLPARDLYTKDGSILGFVISMATVAELAAAATAVNELLASGALRPRRTETRPLSTADDAHARMERGELHGRRLVLVP